MTGTGLDLNIRDITLDKVPVIPENTNNDPIDNILNTYDSHPSIIRIRIHVGIRQPPKYY